MASLRDIKTKIKGVKKTRQITRAMNMVSAAKLRGVQARTLRFRPYAEKFAEVLARLAQGMRPDSHPLLYQAPQINTVAVLLFTSERGLCGAFNNNLILTALRFIREQEAAGKKVRIYAVGRKGYDYYANRRGQDFAGGITGDLGSMGFETVAAAADLVMRDFLSHDVQEAHMIYSNFRSMSTQAPTLEKILPITPPELASPGGAQVIDYIIEPSAEDLVGEILPRYLNVRVYQALLETATGEHAARMLAMDNATKNCSEIITNLTIMYNKARQAAITSELIDIVSGADAVSG
ncbi:MAG: ATP synthase F1 subunit gamma [Desulfarculales bacterium]|jgi:F-type H+-transporting ATPase subunit gamma|nr:ATP synthase F1 subunit gamma [Desulfarculales bacterium]